MLSTSVKSTITEYTDNGDMTPTISSTGSSSVSSRKRRNCSDEAGNEGHSKRLHSEAQNESDVFSGDGQEGCLKMIASPIVGYDSSAVVSYTVSYLECYMPFCLSVCLSVCLCVHACVHAYVYV